MKASVVIPTFNRAHLILNTINTVLAQDYQPIEIIVVDDGSTDNTRDILTPLINKGVLIFKELSHRGRPAPARNVGLSLATGDVVFLLDSDDLMLPGKISSTVRAFQKAGYQNIGFCCTDFLLRKNDGGEYTHFSSPYYFKFREVPKHKVDEGISLIESRDAYNALLSANYVGTSSVALTKEIVHAGFKFDESLTNSDDYDMWLRLARRYDVLVIESPLHTYTDSPNGVLSTSMRNGNKWRTNIQILKRELKTMSDEECRRSARKRLAEYYRTLILCSGLNKQWLECLKAFAGALSVDALGTIKWLLIKIHRRIFKKNAKDT